MSYYRDQLENYLGKLEIKVDRVLDIGGGSRPVKGRTKSWDVKKYFIADNKLEAPVDKISFETDLNLSIGENLTIQHFSIPENRIDIVFCLEVFEYIWDPANAIKNIWFVLREGGIAYLSFPFIYPIHSPHQNDYLRYTRFGILKLLEIAGLKVIEIIGREAKEPKKLLDFYESDGMHIKADSTITGYLVKCIKK